MTQVHIGKALLYSFTASVIQGGVPVPVNDAATVSSGNPDNLRVTMNPDDNRQFAAVGVAPTPGINANVHISGKVFQTLIEVIYPEPPPGTPPATEGEVTVVLTFLGEVDPPSWA